MKKIGWIIAVFTAALMLTGCAVGSAPDDNSASTVGVGEGAYATAEEFLAAQDTPSTYERRLYEEAVADGYEGSYYQFLESLGLSDDTAYINRAVNSVVEIDVVFSVNGVKRESEGSGVIYSLDTAAGEAYIVTNYHVVATHLSTGFGPWGTHTSTTDWNDITVTLYDGGVISAEDVTLVAGTNDNADLAVLKVTDAEALKTGDAVAATGASAAVGETVYAVGNAHGEGTSVTKGVVSVLDDTVSVTGADNYSLVTYPAIRTDAAVNQGNSGGGLFNAKGELVGIVSARRTQSDTGTEVDGFGYAVSTADVNALLASFGCGTIGTSGDAAASAVKDGSASAQAAAASVVGIETEIGAGSGVILSVDRAEGEAYIVTNYHVVYSSYTDDASDAIVVYLDGSEERLPASFVGGVQSEDIAVVKVTDDALADAAAASIGNSRSLTVGETVYAVGNAAGEGISVTEGVVSVLRENITVASADEQSAVSLNTIRTDAAVNHGNSGGGLFNAMGELVGIVSARSEESGVTGFGYAIGSDHAVAVAENIIAQEGDGTGMARCATLGITVGAQGKHGVYNERTGKVYFEEQTVVLSLSGGGVAYRMGMDVNDTVLAVSIVRGGEVADAQFITAQAQLPTVLYRVRAGDTLEITVSRGGELKELSTVITEGDLQYRG